jgi:hypothetical protein
MNLATLAGTYDSNHGTLDNCASRQLRQGKMAAKTKSSETILPPGDFPLRTNGDRILRKDGSTLVTAANAELAKEIANRLNRDQDKRNEDTWSA